MKFAKIIGTFLIMLGTVLGILSFDNYGYGYVTFSEWIRQLFCVWVIPVYVGMLIYAVCWVINKVIDVCNWYKEYQQDMAMLDFYISREKKHKKFMAMMKMIEIKPEENADEA